MPNKIKEFYFMEYSFLILKKRATITVVYFCLLCSETDSTESRTVSEMFVCFSHYSASERRASGIYRFYFVRNFNTKIPTKKTHLS